MIHSARLAGPVALAFLVATLGGCGGPNGPALHLEAAFGAPEVADARQRAPDLVAAAERARSQAEREARAGHDEAARDHATRARLLLTAALAESKRLALESERLSAERKARALEARALRDERAREQTVAATRHLLAARVAREQAAKAFAEAARDERHGGRRGRADEARQRHAAEVLRDRARLLLAAARALGLPEDDATDVEAAVDAGERARDPADALAQAEAAVGQAMRALGRARRARSDGPPEAEVRALWDDAAAMGFAVEQADRGTVLRPSGSRWSATARTRLTEILLAHPSGPVRIEGVVGGGGRGSARAARARADRLRAVLVKEGVPAERLTAETAPGDPTAADVQVVLVAYALPLNPDR